jgi:hypothetical protein
MIYPSPLEWLRAERRGTVVLNADRARSLLWAAQPLAVDNRQFGLELRAGLDCARAANPRRPKSRWGGIMMERHQTLRGVELANLLNRIQALPA